MFKKICIPFLLCLIMLMTSIMVSATATFDAATKCTTDVIEQLKQLGITNSSTYQSQYGNPVFRCEYKQLVNAKEIDANGNISMSTIAEELDSQFDYSFIIVDDNSQEVIVWSHMQGDLGGVDIKVINGRMIITGTNIDDSRTWNVIFAKYRVFILGVSGIGALSCALGFILMFMRLGTTASNPTARKDCISGLLYTGIGVAGLGGVAIVFGFFYNII